MIRGRNVHEQLDAGVLTLWLDRPEARNGMDPPMLREFVAAVERAARRPEARVLALRGANGDFCTGADLGDMENPVLETSASSIELVQSVARIFAALYDMGKPTVAVIEGWAVAGGFEIAISCDFALAATTAKIGDFHMRRALFPGAGPIYRLPRMIGLRKAKELMLTGKVLAGEEARRWGVVNDAAEPAKLDDLARSFCADLARNSAFAMRAAKLALNRGLDADSGTLEALSLMTQEAVFRSADARECVAAEIEGRAPTWKDC